MTAPDIPHWLSKATGPDHEEAAMATERNERHGRGDPSGKGSNLSQGLAGLRDDQRRDLAGRGGHARTKDQSGVSTSGGQGGPNPSRSDRHDEPR